MRMCGCIYECNQSFSCFPLVLGLYVYVCKFTPTDIYTHIYTYLHIFIHINTHTYDTQPQVPGHTPTDSVSIREPQRLLLSKQSTVRPYVPPMNYIINCLSYPNQKKYWSKRKKDSAQLVTVITDRFCSTSTTGACKIIAQRATV